MSIPLLGFLLNKSSTVVIRGKTETLIVSYSPADATNKTLYWSSSDQTVATVAEGVITAVAPGTTIITAISDDGGYKHTCEVQVPGRDRTIEITFSQDLADIEGDISPAFQVTGREMGLLRQYPIINVEKNPLEDDKLRLTTQPFTQVTSDISVSYSRPLGNIEGVNGRKVDSFSRSFLPLVALYDLSEIECLFVNVEGLTVGVWMSWRSPMRTNYYKEAVVFRSVDSLASAEYDWCVANATEIYRGGNWGKIDSDFEPYTEYNYKFFAVYERDGVTLASMGVTHTVLTGNNPLDVRINLGLVVPSMPVFPATTTIGEEEDPITTQFWPDGYSGTGLPSWGNTEIRAFMNYPGYGMRMYRLIGYYGKISFDGRRFVATAYSSATWQQYNWDSVNNEWDYQGVYTASSNQFGVALDVTEWPEYWSSVDIYSNSTSSGVIVREASHRIFQKWPDLFIRQPLFRLYSYPYQLIWEDTSGGYHLWGKSSSGGKLPRVFNDGGIWKFHKDSDESMREADYNSSNFYFDISSGTAGVGYNSYFTLTDFDHIVYANCDVTDDVERTNVWFTKNTGGTEEVDNPRVVSVYVDPVSISLSALTVPDMPIIDDSEALS